MLQHIQQQPAELRHRIGTVAQPCASQTELHVRPQLPADSGKLLINNYHCGRLS